MTDRVVIDASVALARLVSERETATVDRMLREWVASGTELLVPSLFWLEISNALVRRHRWTPGDVMEALVLIDGLHPRTVALDRPILLLALAEMERAGLSAYDAFYLALAHSTDSHLATLDRRLADAAGSRGLLVDRAGTRRLHEASAIYGAAPEGTSWAHSAVVGAHIAELRRRAPVSAG